MTGPLKADKKAQSLVPQIVEAHSALVEAESKGFRQSLALAIDLGVLLNLAKGAVYHGHWEEWFSGQGFKFSYRSANRFMRLAENREKLEEAASSPRVADLGGEGELSVRRAEVLLRPDKPETAKPAAVPPKRRGEDLAAVLVDKAPDEILSGIGDHEKREELLQHQLRKETPIGVRYLLAAVWDIPKLKELVKELTEQIAKTEQKEFTRRPGIAVQAST